jgi:glycosyltransferase involved in cell wall biosynthesis
LLLIVGDGKNKKDIEDIIKKENLENVLLLKPIPKDEVQSLLQYFDICYIGLQNKKIFEYGVSPNKLYEYLYAKKPVLYAINDKNSIVKLSKSGFQVDSNNPKEIADGIVKLYSLSDEKLKKMSENGYKYVIENHTYKQIAEKFMQEIEEI